jgi:hypothetical protein
MKSRLEDFYMMTEDKDVTISRKAVRQRRQDQQLLAEEATPNDPEKAADETVNTIGTAVDMPKLDQSQRAQDGEERVPFLFFKMKRSTKTHGDRIGSVIRYDKVAFGIQEFFIQVETNIVNNNLALCMEILNVFSIQNEEEKMTTDDEYKKAFEVGRAGLCGTLDARRGVVFDATQLKVEKIYFGVI